MEEELPSDLVVSHRYQLGLVLNGESDQEEQVALPLVLTDQEEQVALPLVLTDQEEQVALPLVLTDQEEQVALPLVLTNQEEQVALPLVLTDQEEQVAPPLAIAYCELLSVMADFVTGSSCNASMNLSFSSNRHTPVLQ